MSRRREDRAIHKHTLNLYAGDFEKLQDICRGARIDASKVIRDLLRSYINSYEEERRFTAAHQGPTLSSPNRRAPGI